MHFRFVRLYFKFCLFIIGLLLNISANSQTNLFFETVKSPGLSTPVTRALAQDKEGYLYIGTNDGLFKYDGYQFKKFPTSGEGKLACPIQNIRYCLFDGSFIWIAGIEGLAKLNTATKEFSLVSLATNEEENLRPAIKCLKKLNDTEIVVGTYRSFSIIEINTGKIRSIQMPQDFKEGDFAYLTAFLEDAHKNIWIGTNKAGLYLLKNGDTKPKFISDVKEISALSELTMFDMLKLSEEEFYLATDQGLFAINTEKFSCRQIFLSESKLKEDEPFIRKLLKTADGEIYLVSYGSGLYQFFPQTEKAVQYQFSEYWFDGINDNYLNDMIEGSSQISWIATENSGIVKLNNWLKRFEYVLFPLFPEVGGSLNVTGIKKINGTLWMTTSAGLMKYTADGDLDFLQSDLYELSYLQNLQVLNDTYLIFQVWEYGIGTYNLKTNKYGYLQLPGKKVEGNEAVLDWLSYTDKNNNFYCADFQGNYLKLNYTNGSIDTLFTPQQVKLSLPIAIPINEDELIIISGSKLYDYNISEQKLKLLEADKHGNRIPPVSFQEDILIKNELIYLATNEGFFIYNQTTDELKHFSEINGLPSQNCFSLYENKQGEIMIALGEGEAKFHEKNETFSFYPLPYLEGFSPIPFYDEEGNYYLGADNSFIKTTSGELETCSIKPEIRISSITAGNNIFSGEELKKIKIRQKDFPLEIHYEMLDYINSRSNKIGFILEGWDKNWIGADMFTFKTIYSKLNGGDYIFKLKGINAAGNFADDINIPIKVLPPVWQTWWFITIILAALVFIPYSFYRYRLNQLRSMQMMRNKIASDLHDDVGSTLSSIRMYSELVSLQIKEKNPESIPLLERMSNNSKEMIESMSDIVWAIKPANDAFKNIESRMFHFASELCSAKNIELQFEKNESLAELKMKMEQRRDLYLIFKEAVNNAVKYSGCSKLSITFDKSGELFNMKISDNGIGFDTSIHQNGNGMANMKRRAESQHGTLQIHSSNTNGTTIELNLIPKN